MSGLNIVVTPEIVRRLEDNMQYVLVSHWAGREQDLWWRRVVKTRQATTKREIVQWLVESAGIESIGNGGSLTYDDLVEATHEITVEKFGKGLRLSDDEIEDGAAFDRAGAWARQVAAAGAHWVQDQAVRLLKEGKVKGSYDGVPFFATNHPVKPGGGGGLYANLHYNMPFSVENLAKAYRLIAGIKSTDGKYRKIRPRTVLAGEVERLAVTQALGAEFFADPVRSGTTASAQNVVKTSYGFDAPIISPDFDEITVVSSVDRGVWYLVCDPVDGDEFGPLVYSERKAFSLNSYSPLDSVTLGQMDAFEYHFKGRNGASYGHPFAIHRFEPGPSP